MTTRLSSTYSHPWQSRGGFSMNQTKLPETKHRHDIKTGQIFAETEVPFHKRHYSDWIGELKTPSLLRKPTPNQHGARTLLDMSKMMIARQLRQLTPNHFAAVPWSLAEQVWEDVVTMHGESFQAWRTLASAYPNAQEFGKPEFRYQLQIRQPFLPLSVYLAGITPQGLQWLTSLRISPKQLSRPDLVSLGQVENLAVLDLSDGQITVGNKSSPFDARIMRAWAELASQGCFGQLRVLLLGWQEHVSSWIFDYVDEFPALNYIIITDCGKMHQKNRAEWEPIARKHGWEGRHAKKSTKSLRPLIKEDTFYLGAVSGCYYDSQQLSDPNLEERLPMLECWIGTPRLWTHIIDDFPGTRTIFFERTEAIGARHSSRHADCKIGNGEHFKRIWEPDQLVAEARSPPSKRGPKLKGLSIGKGKVTPDLLRDLMS